MNQIGHRSVIGGLLGIHALTALHPGTGAALGTVDLPIQRERQNGWPNIAGSALKGILRDAQREQWMKANKAADRSVADRDNTLLALFGASKGHAENENAGSLAVTDARLIAFPIRSLKGAFAWVTCPAALERLRRDLMLVGEKANELEFTQTINEFEAVTAPNSPLIVGEQHLQLDDETLTIIKGDSSKIASWIASHLLPNSEEYESTRSRLTSHLVIVSDSDFTHIVKYATEVTARIGLDPETKTVKDGALFYQEFVPTEAIFYSVTLVNASRMTNNKSTAVEMLQSFSSSLSKSPVLQIGGDETTGKGLCAVRHWTKEVK